MAKELDKEARRAALQAEMDALDTDDDVEVHVRDEKGRTTILRGSHGKRWLKNLGLDDDEEAGDVDDEDQGDEDEDPAPAKRTVRSRMFDSNPATKAK